MLKLILFIKIPFKNFKKLAVRLGMTFFLGIGRYEELLMQKKTSRSSFQTLTNNLATIFVHIDEVAFQHDDYAKIVKFLKPSLDLMIQAKLASERTLESVEASLGKKAEETEQKNFSVHYLKKIKTFKTALENRHLLPNWLNGAFLGYPASETCFTEPGRGEKGIPKSGNDSRTGPVPRVTDERSERAKSITLPPSSENQWLKKVGLRRGPKEPLVLEKPAGRGAYTLVEGLVASSQILMKQSEGLNIIAIENYNTMLYGMIPMCRNFYHDNYAKLLIIDGSVHSIRREIEWNHIKETRGKDRIKSEFEAYMEKLWIKEMRRNTDKISISITHRRFTSTKQIFVRISNQKTVTLRIEDTQSIKDLQIMIQEQEGILIEQQNIFFAGKPLQKYKNVPLNLLGITEGSTISLLIGLKGGTDSLEEQPDWKLLYDSFSEVINYFKGGKTYSNEIKTFRELEGTTINDYLCEILKDSVDIINPDLNSIYNIFDGEIKNSVEGINDLVMQLLDIKANLLKVSAKEAVIANPDFIKPIIAILNTKGKTGYSHGQYVDPQTTAGSHWVCLVILPKDFQGFLYQSMNLECIEKVVMFASAGMVKEFPLRFRVVMTQGTTFIRENKHEYVIPKNMIDPNSTYKIYNTIQQNAASCGYWAIFNSIMMVMTGQAHFFEEFTSSNIKEEANGSTRSSAENYLRQTIEYLYEKAKTEKREKAVQEKSTEQSKSLIGEKASIIKTNKAERKIRFKKNGDIDCRSLKGLSEEEKMDIKTKYERAKSSEYKSISNTENTNDVNNERKAEDTRLSKSAMKRKADLMTPSSEMIVETGLQTNRSDEFEKETKARKLNYGDSFKIEVTEELYARICKKQRKITGTNDLERIISEQEELLKQRDSEFIQTMMMTYLFELDSRLRAIESDSKDEPSAKIQYRKPQTMKNTEKQEDNLKNIEIINTLETISSKQGEISSKQNELTSKHDELSSKLDIINSINEDKEMRLRELQTRLEQLECKHSEMERKGSEEMEIEEPKGGKSTSNVDCKDAKFNESIDKLEKELQKLSIQMNENSRAKKDLSKEIQEHVKTIKHDWAKQKDEQKVLVDKDLKSWKEQNRGILEKIKDFEEHLKKSDAGISKKLKDFEENFKKMKSNNRTLEEESLKEEIKTLKQTNCNIEGKVLNVIDDINVKVIPFITKVNRTTIALTNRMDAFWKYRRNNRHLAGEEERGFGINIEALEKEINNKKEENICYRYIPVDESEASIRQVRNLNQAEELKVQFGMKSNKDFFRDAYIRLSRGGKSATLYIPKVKKNESESEEGSNYEMGTESRGAKSDYSGEGDKWPFSPKSTSK